MTRRRRGRAGLPSATATRLVPPPVRRPSGVRARWSSSLPWQCLAVATQVQERPRRVWLQAASIARALFQERMLELVPLRPLQQFGLPLAAELEPHVAVDVKTHQCFTSFPKRNVGSVMRDMQRPPSLGLVNTKLHYRRRPIAATTRVLCDPSRSGYAIAHMVCACAAPVRVPATTPNRRASENHISIKMSPPFGCVGTDYTNAKHIMVLGGLQASISASAPSRVALLVTGTGLPSKPGRL